MVPREPELSIWRGLVHVMCWAVTIWWMPTPVEKKQSSIRSAARMTSFIFLTTYWADILVRISSCSDPSAPCTLMVSGRYSGTGTGYSFSSSALYLSHDRVVVAGFAAGLSPPIPSSALMARRKSTPVEWMKKLGSTCLACSDLRMSTWMTPPRPSTAARRASGRNDPRAPVMRSSKRLPMLMRRSHSCTIKLGVAWPCMPSMLRANGWRSSNTPMAWRVVVTGIWRASANASNSAGASLTPCPATMTGFRAWRMRSSMSASTVSPASALLPAPGISLPTRVVVDPSVSILVSEMVLAGCVSSSYASSPPCRALRVGRRAFVPAAPSGASTTSKARPSSASPRWMA
mmetsp:Transcript_30902/g.90330  ORF Transcript_30902/g.90330 Transcript_30902/m.90330 type:complete len:346 (+) Transcript_30902:601-1638(+)